MNDRAHFDFVILGGGTAAESAATEARARGLSVALIESGTIGGTCLNVGCTPSKILLAAAGARARAVHRSFPGVPTSAEPVDLMALMEDKDGIIGHARQRDHVEGLAAAGIEVIRGRGRFTGSTADAVHVSVSLLEGGERRLSAANVIVATGAAPSIPPIPGLSDVDFLTSTTAMSLQELPSSMIVVGGNAIGLEQAQLFQRLGVPTTVIEAADRIAPFEEPASSHALEAALRAEGITIHTGATLKSVSATPTGVLASARTSTGADVEVQGERILIATGRRPQTEELELAAVGLAAGTRGELPVDDHLGTAHPRVWGAGDVTGVAQFVYVAMAQGRTAVVNALECPRERLDYTALSRVTFTSPGIAAVGMTAHQAAAAGVEFERRTLDVSRVPRAVIDRSPHGTVTLISEQESGRLLGVHVVSDDAGELIAAGALAISLGATVDELAGSWIPSFTMAEALRMAAVQPAAA